MDLLPSSGVLRVRRGRPRAHHPAVWGGGCGGVGSEGDGGTAARAGPPQLPCREDGGRGRPIGVKLFCPRQALPTVETPRGASPKRRFRPRNPKGCAVAPVSSDRTAATSRPIGLGLLPLGSSGPPRRRPTGRLYSGGRP